MRIDAHGWTLGAAAALLGVALVIGSPEPAAGRLPPCRAACVNLQANCIGFARKALVTARTACAGEEARACRRRARGTFRAGQRACRQRARKECRPCCRRGGPNACALEAGRVLPAEPQEAGDPARGRHLLLNGDYMTCGIPYRLWQQASLRPLVAEGFGGRADAPRLAEREGANADLPYFLNTFTTAGGVDVVNANCLMCHGGTFDGQLVVGLGNPVADFTRGAGGATGSIPLTDALLDLIGLVEAEKAELRKIAGRAAILGPATMMRTVGMNPAEMFAVLLMVPEGERKLVYETIFWSQSNAGHPFGDHLTAEERRAVIEYLKTL